jgi:hypothetical protein
MWLLDANMDVHLLVLLQEFGQKTEATTKRGWGALNNGDLVSAAVKEGFTCLLTQDRLFAEAASRALKAHPNFAVVVVHLPQRPWPQYQESFKAAWLKSPISPTPGKVIHWPK